MPRIKVLRPFCLRLGRSHAPREFAVGEHEISEAELGHWFFRACLAEGRAVLLPDGGLRPPQPPEAATGGARQRPLPEAAEAEEKALQLETAPKEAETGAPVLETAPEEDIPEGETGAASDAPAPVTQKDPAPKPAPAKKTKK